MTFPAQTKLNQTQNLNNKQLQEKYFKTDYVPRVIDDFYDRDSDSEEDDYDDEVEMYEVSEAIMNAHAIREKIYKKLKSNM